MAKCYHIWTVADGGNGMFRLRRCFSSRSTANTVAKRGVTTDRGTQYVDKMAQKQVLKCLPGCPCGPGRKEHNHKEGFRKGVDISNQASID